MTSLPVSLALEGKYSFTVQRVQDTPTANELLSIDSENERFLKTSSIWQDHPVEVEELDSVGLELRRQDLKISLLMDMVGELLVRQSELPPREFIRLTATGVEFSSSVDEFQEGATAKVRLYLFPAFPRPLQFYGEITESEQKGLVNLKFSGTSIAVQDQIEKLLFTYHRRSIAQEHASTKSTGA